MVACIRRDYAAVKSLISNGAKVNLFVPPPSSSMSTKAPFSRVQPEMHHWTPLHFAVAYGSVNIAKYLLDNGANVEGDRGNDGSLLSCETPLQMASAQGNEEMVGLLLARGADPTLSSLTEEVVFGAEAQRATACAIVLAAGHGRR